MMFYTHLRSAFRYLRKNSAYTLANLGGLTLGFFCFLLLNFYVSSEKSYDDAHPQVYRLLQQIRESDGSQRESATSGPQVGIEAAATYPEISALTQLMPLGRMTVGNEPDNLHYHTVTTFDDSFFEVFDFPLKEGSPATIFSQTNGIVLTASIAEKFFGQAPALHQPLKTSLFDGVVSGVLEDFPENTHMEAELLLPTQTAASTFTWWDRFTTSNWHRNAFVTYAKLRESADVAALEQKITRLAADNWPEEAGFTSEFRLQPVQDIHLYAGPVEGEINSSRGNLFYVRVFFWIALAILLVACFNYAGLLNVAFMGRYREIGVRKAIGAGRFQLLSQLITESLLLTVVSLLLALGLLQLLQPSIDQLLGKTFDWSYLPWNQIAVLAISGLIAGLIAVIYPAWLVTRVGVVKALKAQLPRQGYLSVRRLVTFFQFTVAIGLIACAIIFYRQLNYMQNKQLGFDMEGLVVIDINSGALRETYQAVKAEFAAIPEVKAVSVTSSVPGEWKQFPMVDVILPGAAADQSREMIFVAGDEDMLPAYDISLLEGSNFSGVPADSNHVLINRAAMEALGLTEAVGQPVIIPTINWSGDKSELEQPYPAKIIGVVEDFHFEDFHLAIKPMIIGFNTNPVRNIDYYTLRIETDDWHRTLVALKGVNDRFDPQNPIEYNILNDRFERFYEADIIRSRLLIFFSATVVFIACLGLLVMTAFTLRTRTKEIGIRKVLGATAGQIVRLIARDFVLLIAGAMLIGIPLARYAMGRWMQEFAYRIDMEWWYFALAGIVAMVVALATVGLQSLRAALANPVEAIQTNDS